MGREESWRAHSEFLLRKRAQVCVVVTHWGTLHSLDGNRKENTAGLSLHPLLLVAVVQRSLVVPKGKVQLSLHGPFRMVISENIQDSPGG